MLLLFCAAVDRCSPVGPPRRSMADRSRCV